MTVKTTGKYDALCVEAINRGLVKVDTESGRAWKTTYRMSPVSVPIELYSRAKGGYIFAPFTIDKIGIKAMMHRLVWIAANGIPSNGLFVCHENNNKTDNRISNLYVATSVKNTRDAVRDGLVSRGEACHKSKLRVDDIERMVKMYLMGAMPSWLSSEFGVSHSRVTGLMKKFLPSDMVRPNGAKPTPIDSEIAEDISGSIASRIRSGEKYT